MSEITTDGLIRSGTGCCTAAVPYDSSGRQMVKGFILSPPHHR